MSLRNLTGLVVKAAQNQRLYLNSSVRFYGRWMHRNPAKVLLPFETTTKVNLKKEKVIDLDPKIFEKSQEKKITSSNELEEPQDKSKHAFAPDKVEEIKKKREEKLKKRKFYLSQQKVFNDTGEIIYEKLKDNDGRITQLLTNLKSKKERLRLQQVMVEGWRLIVDGLEAKCKLKYVIFSRIEDLNQVRPFLPKTGVKIFKIPYKEIELWSDVETSPGLFGVFDMPTEENVQRLSKPLPLQLICDNIRVPGNLGAILRAAVGAGCEKVLLIKGCADVWDPKVMRSAAGAHFRLPIHPSVEWEDMSSYLPENTAVFIADSNSNVDEEDEGMITEEAQIPVVPYYSVEYATLSHITLIIGGETEGISEDCYRLAASRKGLRINIPLEKGVDSLNTGMAAAVIALEIRKQLIQYWTKLKMSRKLAEGT